MESEMSFRQLVERATDIIYTLDLEGYITWINQIAEKITGYTREELLGMPLARLLSSEELRRSEQILQRKMMGQENTVYELEIITKDQQRRTLEINSQLIHNSEGVISIAGIARDITSRKTSERHIITLHHITTALTDANTLQEVVSVIVEQVLKILDADQATVGLISADGQTLELVPLTNPSQENSAQNQDTPLVTPGPLMDTIRTGKLIWIETQTQYINRYPHYAEEMQTVMHTQPAVALPLRIRERILGGILFRFRETRRLTEADREFLEAIADYCAQSVERVRLHEAEQGVRTALQTRVHQQSVVAEMGQYALGSTDLVTLLDLIANRLAQTLAVEYVKILELHPEENHLLLKAGVGWKAGYVGRAQEGTDVQSPAGYTLKAQIPVIVTDLSTETRFSDPPLLHEHGVVSGMSVIIQGYTRPYGVLGVYTAQRRTFSQDDVYFLQSVANVIGAAIENTRLLEQAKVSATVEVRQRLARELHDSVTQSLFSATTTAELVPRIWARDPERAMQHLEGVIRLNRGAMAEMRTLLLELRPEAILSSSLSNLYQQLVNTVPARSDTEAEFIVEGEDQSLPSEVHLALYRIAQESINNILKHSQATKLQLKLVSSADEIRVQIIDNGQGFDETKIQPGLGLGSMRERAKAAGAELELVSQPGQGTTVMVRYRTGL